MKIFLRQLDKRIYVRRRADKQMNGSDIRTSKHCSAVG